MKVKRICAISMALCLLMVLAFSPAAGAAAASTGEVRVPLVLDLAEAIAGAEFELEFTSELKLIRLEKSTDIASASLTPVVEKGNTVNLGFYSAGNDFGPKSGVLNVGYLVVDYRGGAEQFLTITEVKTVQVVDKETTKSELITLNQVIRIPLESENAVRVGKPSVVLWVVVAVVALAAGATAIVVFIRRQKRVPGR